MSRNWYFDFVHTVLGEDECFFFFFLGGGGGGWRLGPLGGLPLCTPLARERGPDVCVMVVWVEGQVMAR